MLGHLHLPRAVAAGEVGTRGSNQLLILRSFLHRGYNQAKSHPWLCWGGTRTSEGEIWSSTAR